jgi:hypothetical protein
MKRCFCAVILLCLVLSLCGCTKTSVKANAKVTLNYIYGEKNIIVTLPDDEAQKVIKILDGNSYDPVFSGTPSCGFNKNISLTVDKRVYAIACDTCPAIQDLHNMRYFSVSQEEIDYIHRLFEKYGGDFPCV